MGETDKEQNNHK